ncbi:hypothetical protein CHELA1G11_11553 [Hyphomicrobiales bacterium]|nr:hypothetical protein CHELA1G11_11553 [Hyphomicrobiales bacterium]CAH1666957.1 hypothetical protein CHELA1G2_12756 [Hyphomicrobiales bacterium]
MMVKTSGIFFRTETPFAHKASVISLRAAPPASSQGLYDRNDYPEVVVDNIYAAIQVVKIQNTLT